MRPTNKSNFDIPNEIEDVINMMGNIKIDIGVYNKQKIIENLELKKTNMQNELKNFFDKFLNTNKLIFEELKNTIGFQQVSLFKNMDTLKSNINNYFGVDDLSIVDQNPLSSRNQKELFLSDLNKNLLAPENGDFSMLKNYQALNPPPNLFFKSDPNNVNNIGKRQFSEKPSIVNLKNDKKSENDDIIEIEIK